MKQSVIIIVFSSILIVLAFSISSDAFVLSAAEKPHSIAKKYILSAVSSLFGTKNKTKQTSKN